jgi:TIR domain
VADFLFDVALSYAGEDREYVEQVALEVAKAGLSCFYDQAHQVELWGKNLYDELDTVYRSNSRHAVIFVSKAYTEKPWTNHERRSAQARSLLEQGEYLLPVRMDDSDLPGLSPTIAYLDARTVTAEMLAEMIVRKVKPLASDNSTHSAEPAQANAGWEYILFIEELESGHSGLAERIDDFRSGYVSTVGSQALSWDEAMALIRARSDQATIYVNNLDHLFASDLQTKAFGEPGQPGDADAIRLLARRITDVFQSLLQWADEIRGTLVQDELKPALWALSNYIRSPLARYELFVRDVGDKLRPPIMELRAGRPPSEPITVELTLTVDIDEADKEEFHLQMATLKKLKAQGGL